MKKYIITNLLLVLAIATWAQEYHQDANYIFNGDETGWHIYEAKSSVSLKEGFSYAASNQESFTAKVNNKILFPDRSNAYMDESGNLSDDPTNGYAVGAIPGKFNVSPTGAATYTIPIEVPPGVNGMQPSIALNYNSQAGNGIAGWGWNISGTSAITRVPKTIYHDGKVGGIKWTKNDALALDGNRLFAIKTNTDGSVEYRTEVDNGSKIVGHDITETGPTRFEVFTKDGKTMFYEGVSQVYSRSGGTYVQQYSLDIDTLNAWSITNWHSQDPIACVDQFRVVGYSHWRISEVRDNYRNYCEFHYSDSPSGDSGEWEYGQTPEALSPGDPTYARNVLCSYSINIHREPYHHDYDTVISFKGDHIDPFDKPDLYDAFEDGKEYINNLIDVHGLRKESGYGLLVYKKTTTCSKAPRIDEYISSISYGNKNKELFKVKFNYRDREQQIKGYLAGYKQEQNLRLDSIEVISTYERNNTILKTYTLNYKSGEDRLTSVGLEGMNNERIKETEFINNANAVSSDFITDNSFANDNTDNPPVYSIGSADFNGDGVMEPFVDHLYNKITTPSFVELRKNLYIHPDINVFLGISVQSLIDYSSPIVSSYAMGDFYTKGATSIAVTLKKENYSGKKSLYFYSFHSGKFESSNEIVIDNAEQYPFLIKGDFNKNVGDELVLIKKGKSEISGGFQYEAQLIENAGETITNFSIKVPDEIIAAYSGNFHDNNKSDLFIITENGSIILESNIGESNLFQTNIGSYSLPITSKNYMTFGNLNDDGLTDILYQKSDNSWNISYSTGDGSGNLVSIGKVTDQFSYINSNVVVVDFNQDGKNDIAFGHGDETSSEWFTILNNGLSFSDEAAFSAPVNALSLGVGRFETSSIPKLCMFSDYLKIYEACFDANPQRVDMISDGYGNEIDIKYSTLNASSDYDNVDYQSNGYLHIKSNDFELVESFSNQQGNYFLKYAGALLDLDKEHGFLGFKKTQICDENTNMSKITIRRLDDNLPLLLPQSVLIKKGENVVHTSEQDYYTVKPYLNNLKISRSQLSYSIKQNKLNGTGTKTSYINYDDYGNPTNTKIQYYDGDNFISGMFQQTIATYTAENKGSWCDFLPSSIVQSITKGGLPESHTTTYLYNDFGKPTQKITDPGLKYEVKTTYSEYNKFGSPESVAITTPRDGITGNNRLALSTYTSDGRFLASKTSGGMTTSYLYDLAKSHLLAETASSGLSSYYFYDGLGQKCKTQNSTGVESYSTRHWAGSWKTVCSKHDNLEDCSYWCKIARHKKKWFPVNDDVPDGALYYSKNKTSGIAEMLIYYNEKGQELRTVSRGFNNKKIYTDKIYNEKNQLIVDSLSSFLGDDREWVSYVYDDDYERLTDVVSSDGAVAKTIYDDAGRRVVSKVTKNGITQQNVKTSNALGQDSISEDNLKNKVHYRYDVAGRLKESWINDNTQHKTVFTYDTHGNRLAICDPDAGTITNTYNALGQVLSQTNAKGQVTTYIYDDCGRVLFATTQGTGMDPEILTYKYLSYGTAIGQLSWILQNGYLKECYSYDKLGRMNGKTEYIDNKKFSHSNTYDDYGRMATQTYPSGYTIANVYNERGDLWQITNGGQVIYENKDYTAQGILTDYNLKNSNITRSHDELGRLIYQGGGSFQSQSYGYDAMGNLSYRNDDISLQKETFAYDDLNRLVDVNYHKDDILQSGDKQSMIYNATGNILSKTNVGADMAYGANGKPHALTSINIPMGYQPLNQNISYTYFNKAKQITQGTYTYDYTYGIDKQRRKTVYKDGANILRTKYYLGNYEKVIENGITKEYHYLSADAGLFGIFVKENGNVGTLKYVLTDHLGSLTGIIDATSGAVEHSASLDAWGKPRDSEDWTSAAVNRLFADRGFTGHEHLPSVFGLIDMNGRMYDPVVGRFLSPDPYVQASDYAQSFNRYAYCLNNPLMYTDPSGEILTGIGGSLLGNYIIGGLNNWINNDMSFSDAFSPSNGSYGTSIAYNSSSGEFGVAKHDGYVDYEEQVDAAITKGIQRISFTDASGNVYYSNSGSFAFSSYTPNAFGRMKENSWLGGVAYGMLDPFYVTAQNFTVGAYNSRHLNGNGAIGSEALDAGINALSELALGYSLKTVIGLAKTGKATKIIMSEQQLLTKAAQKAEVAIGGRGRFAGIAKHTYANKLLARYQNIHGSRGLEFNNYFNNGVGNRGFLDVVNHDAKIIYDFKFGKATWSPGQFQKYQRNFSGYSIQIVRP